ncbi:MAG: chorismate synthase [Defluviitaleaceae bacterium]|nr:chorismate synthase [Defluviitaleaceae bacterium]
MAGSIFGKQFSISTWGESHGKAIGAVVDGCPAGILLENEDIQKLLDRRKPGVSPFATPRKEEDIVDILSGTFEGKTTGTPISMLIKNRDQRSEDYDRESYRPGHADYTYDLKYGFRDYRGAGRSSGRETAARVAGGAVAKKFLAVLGVDVRAYTYSIGNVAVTNPDFSITNHLNMPDETAYNQAAQLAEQAKQAEDSLGGEIMCEIFNIPAGIGEPVFSKLEAIIAQAVLSIGAVKGIAFGAGFDAAKMNGSKHNDIMYMPACRTGRENGAVKKRSNNAGGVYGGISDGSTIFFKAAVKPTSSIGQTQDTINNRHENIKLTISGRHDPLIVPRAVVVVEAMAALSIADLILQGLSANVETVKRAFFR